MYCKAIVTFLDILGFRQLVTESSPEIINEILDVLEKVATPDKKDGLLYNPETIIFSDSIVRVRKVDNGENSKYPIGLIFNELLDIVHAQSHLIDYGIFIRGGIAFDDISLDENRIFGPALIRAYDLENNYAKYPRLVLDPALIKEYKTNNLLKKLDHSYEMDSEYVKDLIRQGDDGLWYVDYGRAVEGELDDLDMYPNFLKRHREVIIQAGSKYKDINRDLEKYFWLATYHNSIVEELPDEWFEEYALEKADLLIGTSELPALESV